jgi:hypothetical protein
MTKTEYDSLTPAELEIELEEATRREQRENDKENRLLKFLDIHFALQHTITHNANFKRSAKVSDYRIIEESQPTFSPEILAIDAKLRADAQKRVEQKRRNKILKQ